jgi:hypothetical protein
MLVASFLHLIIAGLQMYKKAGEGRGLGKAIIIAQANYGGDKCSIPPGAKRFLVKNYQAKSPVEN